MEIRLYEDSINTNINELKLELQKIIKNLDQNFDNLSEKLENLRNEIEKVQCNSDFHNIQTNF